MRRFTWCLLVVTLAVALACSGAMAKTKITYMTWFTGQGLQTKQQLIAEFMEQNPDIEVEIMHATGGPQGLAEKVAVMSAGDAAPDVTDVQHAFIRELLTSDLWADLSPFIEKDADFNIDDYFPELVKFYNRNTTAGGPGQVALPTVAYAGALYYNIDLFDQSGLLTPVAYHEDGIWNWETFEQVARKITKDADGDGTPETFGFTMMPNWIWGMIVRDNGGRLYTEDGRRTLITEPEVIEATQWMADLMNVQKIAKWDTWDFKTFQQGRGGMFVCALWMADILNGVGTNLRYDAAPVFSRSPEVRHHDISGDGLGIPAASKNKEAAWKLVKFLLSEGPQMVQGKTIGIPVLADVARSEEFIRSDTPPYNMSAFVYELAEKSSLVLPRYVPKEAGDLVSNASMEVFRGNKSAITAFAEVADSVNAILQQAQAE